MLDTDLSRLAGLIYDAALDPAYAPELIETTARIFHGCNATFGIAGTDLRLIPRFDSLTPPEVLAGYQEVMTEDPWCQALISRPRSGAFLGTDLIDQKEYRRCETYWRFNRPCDIEYLAVAAPAPGVPMRCWLTVNRTRRQGDFSAKHRRALDYLLGHVARAGKLYWHGNIPADAEIVSGSNGVTSVASGTSQVIEQSPSLSIDGNGIRSTDRKLDRRLQEAAFRAAHAGEVVELHLPLVGTDHLSIIVTIAPKDPRRKPSQLRTTLSVRSTAGPTRQRGTDALRQLYDLTPSEAAIVLSLCRGQSVAEIARHRRTSLHGVRFHLKNIFQKLHVSRQSELVSRITTGPAARLVGRKKPRSS